MSQAEKNTTNPNRTITKLHDSYYAILGLHPSASAIDIRRSYRQLSKRYHPDTTELPYQEAKTKFQTLNEAYATLSNPQKRSLYDLTIGYSYMNVIQPRPNIARDNQGKFSHSAYLDPSDRPLSAGEMLALLMLGVTLVGCLLLAIAIAAIRGDAVW